ncbi:potassium channel family protein [candidate division NPL-UPA2 bacterium]|nr:potassium channel family protein [candidate division NPL-UPA2 bacterium]
MTLERKVKLAVIFLVIIVVGGTAGYMLIEGWTFLESLFMTVITISTVGFGEVRALSSSGRVFSLFLIVFSLSTIAYCVTLISSFILEGHFQEMGRKRKMEARIGKIKNHYIICGEGKVAE